MDVNEDLEQRCAQTAAGVTIPQLLHRNAVTYPDLPALSSFGADDVLTWRELRNRVAALSQGLASLGVGNGDRVIMMMPNRIEHWITDLAAVHLGAIPCTAYSTLTCGQLRYLGQHSAAKVLVINGAEEFEKWRPVLGDLPDLRHVIVVEPETLSLGMISLSAIEEQGAAAHAADLDAFEKQWRQVRSDQPVTLLYTSGTTGDPKGVVLSHHNVIYQCAVLEATVEVPDRLRTIAYLPLAHIAERVLGIYNLVYRAGHVTIVDDPTKLLPALRAVKPHSFFGVPRVWEKMAAGTQAQFANADATVRAAFDTASALARESYRARADCKTLSEDQATRLAELDQTVLRPLRALLGLDEMRWAGSGAAPIPVEVLQFLAGLGLDVLEVWGMTETTGTATINTPTRFRAGTVGRINAGMRMRLLDDGEIQVRGPLVCQGYLNASGGVDPIVDADGWLSTGDIGELDEDGFLKITDRKKELIINSSGKNVAPAQIENLLRVHPLIGQAVAIGDRRPYIVALIVLDEEVAPLWAASRGLPGRSLAALAVDPTVYAAIASAVASANERLARPEQVKKFHIMTEAWTPESGELTPTSKLRRRIIVDKHAATIDALYNE